MKLPQIIQGGMGIGISGWQLASAVASAGQMGVISGLCLDEMLARKLQLGDPGGYMRRALAHFPVKEISTRIIATFFKEKGKNPDESYIISSKQSMEMPPERVDLIVAGSFVEMFLAKEGHSGLVGVNMLEKVQTDCLPTLYGCMLAGADFVTMGAGIPREIPGVLDRLSRNEEVSFRAVVTNALSTDDYKIKFDPSRYGRSEPLKRPNFFAIIASNILAITLAKKSNGKVDGFIVESPIAGGHNAPPRGHKPLDAAGEPVYGEKDNVDLEKIQELGIPFWLAGGYCLKGKLKEALAKGARGVQVGTPFMLCDESGLFPKLRDKLIKFKNDVLTNSFSSPTGFPFKEVMMPGTLAEESVFLKRPRVCNLGFLQERYRKEDGSVGYRCSAEPIKSYVAKGGREEDALRSKCLCNALFANIGLGSVYKSGYHEDYLITAGNVLTQLDYIYPGTKAKDVIEYLLGD